ncbi:hypothetical protein Trydic_g15194 [Trypoxylus dichotomus]
MEAAENERKRDIVTPRGRTTRRETAKTDADEGLLSQLSATQRSLDLGTAFDRNASKIASNDYEFEASESCSPISPLH